MEIRQTLREHHSTLQVLESRLAYSGVLNKVLFLEKWYWSTVLLLLWPFQDPVGCTVKGNAVHKAR